MKQQNQSHRVNSREHLKELTQGKFKYFTLEFDGHTIQRYGMTQLVSESYRIPNKVKEELADDEYKDAENAITLLSGGNVRIEDVIIPDTDLTRKMIIIEKIEKIDDKYPRRAGVPLKKPLR